MRTCTTGTRRTHRLGRNSTTQLSNPAWLIPTSEDWLYLAAVMDRPICKIVGQLMHECLRPRDHSGRRNMVIGRRRPPQILYITAIAASATRRISDRQFWPRSELRLDTNRKEPAISTTP